MEGARSVNNMPRHRTHPNLRNLLGWEPELVRVTQTVKFTGDGFLLSGHVCSVVGVEPDELGLAIHSHDFPPRLVSLHPSEFEVLTWRPPSPVPAAGNVAGG
jgi:hypothetical protein